MPTQDPRIAEASRLRRLGQGQLGGLGDLKGVQEMNPQQLIQFIKMLQRQADQPIAMDRFGMGLMAPSQTRGAQAGQGIRQVLQALRKRRAEETKPKPTFDPSGPTNIEGDPLGTGARAATEKETKEERAALKKAGRLFEEVAGAAAGTPQQAGGFRGVGASGSYSGRTQPTIPTPSGAISPTAGLGSIGQILSQTEAGSKLSELMRAGRQAPNPLMDWLRAVIGPIGGAK